MSFQWPISTDRLFRRCQRQFFFREIAASHAARDWRREAFILKQLKTLELWRGTVGRVCAMRDPESLYGEASSHKEKLSRAMVRKVIYDGFNEDFGESGLDNPTIGTWEVLSRTEGLVCTTGWPFSIPGTVEPLVVLLARGNLDLVKILEDTFRMAQLCWPTPTGCMRLPVDLKLCDEHLRAFAGRADEHKAVYGESEEEADEPLLAAAK